MAKVDGEILHVIHMTFAFMPLSRDFRRIWGDQSYDIIRGFIRLYFPSEGLTYSDSLQNYTATDMYGSSSSEDGRPFPAEWEWDMLRLRSNHNLTHKHQRHGGHLGVKSGRTCILHFPSI